MIGNLTRRFYGTDNPEERKQGELCFVMGSCEAPQYLLVDSKGKQFWWRQDLTSPANVSIIDQLDYWQSRAIAAENKLLKVQHDN